MSKAIRLQRTVKLHDRTGDGAEDISISALIVLPPLDELAADPRVLFCLPGGGMNKAYFDLDAGGDRSFSFAEAMAKRGWITIAIDHPGVGDSTSPEDGFILHPGFIAGADSEAVEQLKAMLRAGLPGYRPIPSFTAIGVGHSMGGMLTGVTQALHAPFDGIAILGAGPYGLIEHLEESLKPLANDPARAWEELVPRLRALGNPPYMHLTSSAAGRTFFHSGDKAGVNAMRAARSQLVVTSGTFSMIPGSWTPQAAAIDVPVFLAFGDQDICRSPSQVPDYFKASPAVTLSLLPETGHSHFIFPSRAMLWKHVIDWAETVPARPN